ncbi:hypothetical protein OGH69_03580 [Flavobacterium sp. MFBS3-15]|uniref:DUF6705 family protein n=1 Tax=Flavobacterium sp. MFBS3-15 TaxID=2989816 RepID=UPI0022354656|nr:DUF6705 family protein [Flavobacterium sp. MFBS3-15]MCW4468035.1 hypothetical protein [Flavobacterium sp. MFBS3-15]
MKAIFIILLFTLSLCKAQIQPILEQGIGLEAGFYYKDTFNELDKFTGTWRYESGSILFEITLQKKEKLFNGSNNNYCDILVGEYRYVDGTNTIVNTLQNLLQNLGPYENNISGANIQDSNHTASERRVELTFKDPERDYLYRYIVVKHFVAQGGTPERIEITFNGEMSIVPEGTPTELRVPEQNYTLIKVP